MILVDTSVLINYFKGTSTPSTDALHRLIDKGIPFGITALIYQEILQGVRDRKEFNLLRQHLAPLPFYELKEGRGSIERAASLYSACRAKGITVRSTIDVLIAQIAIENNLLLLHDDRDFEHLATAIKELKIFTAETLSRLS